MASYAYTFTSGDTVTPTKLNNARTVSEIVNADIKSDAAIGLSKLATGALPTAITVATANIVDANVTPAKLSGEQTGSAPIFGIRAWANFHGGVDSNGSTSTANTNRQIRASGNVTSVLRNAVGNYTVTLTTALQDTNYSVIASVSRGTASSGTNVIAVEIDTTGKTTTSFSVRTNFVNETTNGAFEAAAVEFVVIR
jgi:hypothetical protein